MAEEKKVAESAEVVADSKDAEQNKAMAIIGYIIPVLFFIPLVTDAKDSPFAKFHSNQQLSLLLVLIAVYFMNAILPDLLSLFFILPLGTIFLIVMAVMGVINASGGKMKELPLIGKIKLIK
ncbi:MAG TPA: DUF4870 domain-containing protein [Candidatus Moranbacteria bacterium]|nr:DUF4870 domain-containing protein [Candidatus Moranbacteria bacterium]